MFMKKNSNNEKKFHFDTQNYKIFYFEKPLWLMVLFWRFVLNDRKNGTKNLQILNIYFNLNL